MEHRTEKKWYRGKCQERSGKRGDATIANGDYLFPKGGRLSQKKMAVKEGCGWGGEKGNVFSKASHLSQWDGKEVQARAKGKKSQLEREKRGI